MKKDEFLRLLREALQGDVPAAVIEENIRYYNNYISEEMGKGRSEEEVIAEIGDPRLIANTIEDTTDGASDGGYEETYDGESRYGGYQRESQADRSREDESHGSFHVFNLSGGIWRFLIPIAIFCVLFLIVNLVFTVVGGIFAFLSPVLGPLLLIWFVVWLFKRSGRRR